MTQLKLILAAILAIFGRLLALPTLTARRGDDKRGGIDFMCALGVVIIAVLVSDVAFADYHWEFSNYDSYGNGVILLGIVVCLLPGIIADNRQHNNKIAIGYTGMISGLFIISYALLIFKLTTSATIFNGLFVIGIAGGLIACIWALTDNVKKEVFLLDTKADIKAHGENGYTILHIVANTENSDYTLKLIVDLIKRGADVKAKNDFGETPSDLAISKHGKDSRIARLLLKHEGKE